MSSGQVEFKNVQIVFECICLLEWVKKVVENSGDLSGMVGWRISGQVAQTNLFEALYWNVQEGQTGGGCLWGVVCGCGA